MTDSADLNLLTLSSLRHRCLQESDRFFKRLSHDPQFCFELFRRAVMNHDDHCWQLIYEQYQPLVTGWVERHPLYFALDEESQFFVNWAFAKMWNVITPEKFAQFPDLKSVLRYLQMCVHSVIVDAMRSREQAKLLESEDEDALGGAEQLHAESPSLEEQVQERAYGEALWQLLDRRLKNTKERQVIYGSFILALKPGEIVKEYPETFRNVQEVYLVKDNVIARLRRDPELLAFLST